MADAGVLGQSWQQLQDFLQSLYAQQAPPVGGSDGVNPYAAAASVQGPLGTSPTGAMPGGGVMDYQAATPGAPGMGFPALQGGAASPLPLPPMNTAPPAAAPPAAAPMPARPITPMPPPRPKDGKKSLNPAKTDLGMNPHFTTVQYGVGGGRGQLSSNPIFTALNLGAS